jgi:hypothetical protein
MTAFFFEWWAIKKTAGAILDWLINEAWPFFDAVPGIVFDFIFAQCEFVGVDLSLIRNGLRCLDWWVGSDYLLLLFGSYLTWYLTVWALKITYKLLPSLLGGH